MFRHISKLWDLLGLYYNNFIIILQVIKGLQVGNEALKKVNELISIEDVEKILDETRESIEKQREIDEMLQGVLTNEDEEDVEKEYEKMMAESLIPTPEPKVPIAEPEEFASLPEVPSEGNHIIAIKTECSFPPKFHWNNSL